MMATWPLKRMDELCEITSSKRIFAADYVSEGVPFYRGREITEKYKGNLDVSTELFITEEKFQEIERKFGAPKQGDLLLTSVGTLGSVYVVKPGDRFYFKDGNLTWFRHFKGLNSQFLYYWIDSPQGKAELQKCTIGSSQSAFTIVLLKSMEIKLPPLAVQQHIAGILSAYDDVIENSQRRIKILEAMARALYREWFVHLRFPGHENHPRVALPLGEIPQGWDGRFGDLATIQRDGINPFEFPDEEFEHFSIPAFDNGREPAIELGTTILSGKYCIDDSTVLLSKLNPRIPRIWLPVPSGQRRAITSTEFLGLKPQPGVTREFIYAKCCSDQFAGQFGSLAIGTSTSHQRVKPENLLAMPSAVPDRETIARFTKLVSPMLKVCQQLRSQTRNLRRTRDLLLPRLLSGQIDVEATAA
jgi:type I restriction enzyme S subunit